MVHHKHHSIKIPKLTPLIAAGVVVISVLTTSGVGGISINDQIRQKEAEQLQAQNQANVLGAQATDIQSQINQLQEQIASIQAQIDILTARQNELKTQIAEAEQTLNEQQELLSANIRSMYIEGDISPLEMIASSKSIGDFVEKQEYRDRIKDSISDTMDEIERLKQQLDEQNEEVTRNLTEQQNLRADLDTKNAEASSKLASVNQDKAAFDREVNTKSAEIAGLRAQQAAINTGGSAIQRVNMLSVYPGGVSGGGYPQPWASAPLDAYVDSWGMYSRECVSYTAFRVAQRRTMPYWGGRGNAKNWPSNAIGAGIPVDYGSGAQVGDVAISTAGYYGHAMYVEAVYPDGTVKVSQYNYFVRGEYSEMIIRQSGLHFIHF